MILGLMILAAATASQLGDFVVVLTGIMAALWLGTQLKRAWWPSALQKKEVKVGPLPLPVEIVKTLATKEELHELERSMGCDLASLRKQMNQERQTSREAFGKVHHRIDLLLSNSSEMKGELKGIAGNLSKLIDRHLKE